MLPVVTYSVATRNLGKHHKLSSGGALGLSNQSWVFVESRPKRPSGDIYIIDVIEGD